MEIRIDALQPVTTPPRVRLTIGGYDATMTIEETEQLIVALKTTLTNLGIKRKDR